MLAPEEVKQRIVQAFPDADVDLKDLTGTQDHYQARVVSTAFAGKSPVEQHQMVYAALGDAMTGPIHALALKTYTPEAWKRLNGGA
ncbi:MAG: BolA family transcriptional regulator [Polyangiaceae bacterium]